MLNEVAAHRDAVCMTKPVPPGLKPWKPGQSGNPSGKNRKSLVARVDEVLASRGLNPTEEILKLMPTLPEVVQAKLWLELLAFVQGKPKEYLDDKSPDMRQIPTSQLIEMVKANLPELEAAAAKESTIVVVPQDDRTKP